MRGGGGFVGVHNAFGTEYNWTWYEGLLGGTNYYDDVIQLANNVSINLADATLTGQWYLQLGAGAKCQKPFYERAVMSGGAKISRELTCEPIDGIPRFRSE